MNDPKTWRWRHWFYSMGPKTHRHRANSPCGLDFGQYLRILSVVVSLVLGVGGCEPSAPEALSSQISGETMGTTYLVKVVDGPAELGDEALRERIEARLTAVNAALSNWQKDSEVSRFNASPSTDPVPISSAFHDVMAHSFAIHEQSQQRFDVTLAPLINLWGFGPRKGSTPIPGDTAISDALRHVGMSRLLTLSAGALRKIAPEVTINLSAIAKGFGVDQVAEVIESAGIANYLVEIGGELRTKGHNAQGNAWRLGIEKPDAGGRTVQLVVPLSGYAMATSGDYRNFIEHEGNRYSHIIDPVTGRPVTHGLASVTVISETATVADGWATALLVLGDTAGVELADTLGIAAYFIVRSEAGFSVRRTKQFDVLLASDAS